MIRNLVFCAIFLICFRGLISQETTTPESTTPQQYVTDKFDGYNKDYSHCFRFTWLGPGYDNTSEVDGNCNDLSEKFKFKNTPCKQPLIITDNAEPPNMTDLFENYRDYVLCRRSKGQVCLKYEYKYNGKFDNITYMCGKASTDGEGAETSGCFTEYINGYEKRVCVCLPATNSDNGAMPCNSANSHRVSVAGLFLSLLLVAGIFKD